MEDDEINGATGVDDAAPGWDAINAALACIYGDQEPLHMGTLLRYSLGGPDPLDGISVYRRTLPVPHWHYVSYGFSELYDKESDNPDWSGYGFELTFRLRANEDDKDDATAPVWVFSFLQNLARYVFKSGNVLNCGDWMTANGPIALDTTTAICSMGFMADPELPPIDTPNGKVIFTQIVGLTIEEELAAKRWQTASLLETLLPHMPLWITDLERGSMLAMPQIAAAVQAGSERDGSSSGYVYTDVLDVQETKRLLRAPALDITIGARQVEELRALLPLRIPFGRPFIISGPEWQVQFEAGSECAWRIDGQAVKLTMDADCARDFASSVQPREGRYRLGQLAGVNWQVAPTLIRDRDGNVIERIG